MTTPIFEDEQTTAWLMSVTPMKRFTETRGRVTAGITCCRYSCPGKVDAPHATRDEWLELHFAIQELETLLKIDLIRLGEAPDHLRRQIAAEGVVVYEQTETPT